MTSTRSIQAGPVAVLSNDTFEPYVRYVDAVAGSDSNTGFAPGFAWQTFAKVKDWLKTAVDKNTVIIFNGDFTGAGVFELDGLKTLRGGSVAFIGGFQWLGGPAAALGIGPSPTDASGTRLRLSVVPGSIGVLTANPERYIFVMTDGATTQYGAVLDYDDVAGWIDVSCVLFPAGAILWGLATPTAKADWVLRCCDGQSGAVSGLGYSGLATPNIVIAGFEHSAGAGVAMDDCKGVSVVACNNIGGVQSGHLLRRCEACDFGVYPHFPPSTAESQLLVYLFTGLSGVNEASVGELNCFINENDCANMIFSGNVGYANFQGGRNINTERNQLRMGVSEVRKFRDVRNVHMTQFTVQRSSIQIVSPYFHDAFGVDSYAFGYCYFLGTCDVSLDGYFHCNTPFTLIRGDRCRVESDDLSGFVVTCSQGLNLLESVIGGSGTVPSNWSLVPTFGGITLVLERSAGMFTELSKAGSDSVEMVRMVQSQIRAGTVAMAALNFGPNGILNIDDGSYADVFAFSGTNADVGAVAATVRNRGVLRDRNTAGPPGGNLYLGGAGSIAYPGATTNDLSAGTTELCLFKLG
jgi:hypothetical protein